MFMSIASVFHLIRQLRCHLPLKGKVGRVWKTAPTQLLTRYIYRRRVMMYEKILLARQNAVSKPNRTPFRRLRRHLPSRGGFVAF